jgi:hypothetical protein
MLKNTSDKNSTISRDEKCEQMNRLALFIIAAILSIGFTVSSGMAFADTENRVDTPRVCLEDYCGPHNPSDTLDVDKIEYRMERSQLHEEMRRKLLISELERKGNWFWDGGRKVFYKESGNQIEYYNVSGYRLYRVWNGEKWLYLDSAQLSNWKFISELERKGNWFWDGERKVFYKESGKEIEYYDEHGTRLYCVWKGEKWVYMYSAEMNLWMFISELELEGKWFWEGGRKVYYKEFDNEIRYFDEFGHRIYGPGPGKTGS